jgi:hypothetical protein
MRPLHVQGDAGHPSYQGGGPKKNYQKKWSAEEERHKGPPLTPPPKKKSFFKALLLKNCPQVRASLVEAQFFGFMPWIVIQRVTLPLSVFFHFHAAVVCSQLFKEVYTVKEAVDDDGEQVIFVLGGRCLYFDGEKWHHSSSRIPTTYVPRHHYQGCMYIL